MKKLVYFPVVAAAVVFSSCIHHNSTADIPPKWKSMEVESKWQADRESFEKIISDFADGSSKYGYEANVRWKGIPKKFVDHYYDTSSGTLGKASHSLRHRTRYKSSPRAKDRQFSTLINAIWVKEWERIQYKTTPTIVSSTWFRNEIGDCKIWDSDGDDLCSGMNSKSAKNIILSGTSKHPSLKALRAQLPNVEFSKLQNFLTVTDFRDRVELKRDGKAYMEICLDHLVSENFRSSETSVEYGVDVEIISDQPTGNDLKEVYNV